MLLEHLIYEIYKCFLIRRNQSIILRFMFRDFGKEKHQFNTSKTRFEDFEVYNLCAAVWIRNNILEYVCFIRF